MSTTLPAFDVDAICHEAEWTRPVSTSLTVLAGALENEANLEPKAKNAVRSSLVGALRTQARLDRLVAQLPGVSEIAIDRPVFIIGLPRTGSTLVHNLLAQHPDLRVPSLWELLYPVPPGPGGTEESSLVEAAQAYVDEYYRVAPDLRFVHFLDARRPDECHRLMGNTFESKVFEMRYDVPSYATWLRDHDLADAYRMHRLQLQAILSRRGGNVIVLKDPFHLWSLDALVSVYPEARFIHLHRNLVSVVASTSSLCAVVRGARTGAVDRLAIGRQWTAEIARAVGDGSAGRESLRDRPVLDVFYRDMMGDIMGTMGAICNFIGAAITPPAARRMGAYLAEAEQRGHGHHHYNSEDFGLDPDHIRARFRPYSERYGV